MTFKSLFLFAQGNRGPLAKTTGNWVKYRFWRRLGDFVGRQREPISKHAQLSQSKIPAPGWPTLVLFTGQGNITVAVEAHAAWADGFSPKTVYARTLLAS